MIPRNVAGFAKEALDAFPVVVIECARQAGKSTLAGQLIADHDALATTLDDEDTLRVARADPRAFVDQMPHGTLVIDELQRAPELILAIKASIDRNRRPARFVLIGSSNLLRHSRAPDSLAGRAITVQLRPFSRGELLRHRDDFLGHLRSGADLPGFVSGAERADYARAIAVGGFPDVRTLSPRLRNTWFDSYITRLLERDLRDLAPRVDPGRLASVLRLLAANQSGEFVKARVARAAEIPETSVVGYVDLLETMFLIEKLPPWSPNLTSRATSKPKIIVADPGLALRMSRVTEAQLEPLGNPFIGPALEGFVIGELRKQRTWSSEEFELFHFRDRNGLEVDIVAEFFDGRVIGIEVKSGSTVKPEHLKGLSALRDRLGERFIGGYVLNIAPRSMVLGDRLWSVPLSTLWELGR